MGEDLRYPIGKFSLPAEVTEELRSRLIEQIAEMPALLRQALEGLSPEQLDTPYRPGGWALWQVVHHLPDSHLNGYLRLKLALTEELPTIKPYNEQAWLAITDPRLPVEASVRLLEGLHERWASLLRSLSDEQWQRGFIHPEFLGPPASGEAKNNEPDWKSAMNYAEQGIIKVEQVIATYAWHGRHHVAHIKSLRDRMGWN